MSARSAISVPAGKLDSSTISPNVPAPITESNCFFIAAMASGWFLSHGLHKRVTSDCIISVLDLALSSCGHDSDDLKDGSSANDSYTSAKNECGFKRGLFRPDWTGSVACSLPVGATPVTLKCPAL